MRRILEKIFTERCGLPAEVRFSYEEPAEVLPEDEECYIQADRSAGYETGAVWQSMAVGQNAAGSQSMFSGQGQAGGQSAAGGQSKSAGPGQAGGQGAAPGHNGAARRSAGEAGTSQKNGGFSNGPSKKRLERKTETAGSPIGNRKIRTFFSAGILTGIPWKSGISRAISAPS